MQIRQQLYHYVSLMRLNKPIGIFLLLWPTLWALWIAGRGTPDIKIISIFIVGVLLMRSAGCVINDFADRHLDVSVARTKNRPLASGKVSPTEAFILFIILTLTAFALVLLCNKSTIKLAFIGVVLAFAYPFMKRFTFIPQFGLGLAFSWGVPMAFAALRDSVNFAAWFLYATGIIWPLIYDTMYAMVDKNDDIKVGIKSTAILFDHMDKFVIGLLQTLFITMLVIVGLMFRLHVFFYISLILVACLFLYQQWLIKYRHPKKCFQAFLNNNWVGLIIFLGILFSYVCPHPLSFLHGYNSGDLHIACEKDDYLPSLTSIKSDASLLNGQNLAKPRAT